MYWDLVIGLAAVFGVFVVLVLFWVALMVFAVYESVSEEKE